MRPQEIEQIWPQAMRARISARTRELPDPPTLILGFDSEYLTPAGEYQPNVPVCWQWHDGQRGAVQPLHGAPLSMAALTEAVMYLAKDRDPAARHIVLAAWFAQAEISILDKDIEHQVLNQGNGLYGLRWHYREAGRGGKITTYTITLFDLQAYYGRIPLARAAAHLGAGKGDWDHAQTTLQSYRDPAFYAYALQDARLCQQLAAQLHGELTLFGGASPFEVLSAGAYAALVFRRWYVKEDLFQPHPDVRGLALRAYRGSGDFGGCYAPGIHTGEFAEYDGVSMYPTSAAALGFMPRRGDWQQWRVDVDGPDWEDRGIYRAQITWPDGETRRTLLAQVPDAYGVEQYTYPQQAVDAWTGFELRAATRAGCQVRIVAGFYYTDGTDAFNAYLDQLTNIRDQFTRGHKKRPVNPALAAVYKNLGNAMIGKLGQHRAHRVFRSVYNDDTARVEYAPQDETVQRLGGVFMPEWWVLIVGRARAVMMDVIRERAALHAQVDAVLIPDCGESFEHSGILFRRKASGDTLRLAARNVWGFERAGQLVRFAGGGGARDLPECRAALQSWTGQAVRLKYQVQDLVRFAHHAYDPAGHPLLSRHTSTGIYTIPALTGTGGTHDTTGHTPADSSSRAGRAARAAGRSPAVHAGRPGRTAAGSARRRPGPAADARAAGGTRSAAAVVGSARGRAVKLLVQCDQVRTECRCRSGQVAIHRAVLQVLGSLNADVSTEAAQALAAGLSGYQTIRRGHTYRVEVLD